MTLVEPKLNEVAGVMPIATMSLHTAVPRHPDHHVADYGGYKKLSVVIPDGPLPNRLVGPWLFPTPTTAGKPLPTIGLQVDDCFYRFEFRPEAFKPRAGVIIKIRELRFDHSLGFENIDPLQPNSEREDR